MSKYKKINEGIVDKFIEKLFTNVGKKASSTALKTLADKDPQFKKDYEVLQTLQKRMDKRLNPNAKKDAALQRAIKQYG